MTSDVQSCLNIFKFVASKLRSMAGKSRDYIRKITKSYRLSVTDKHNFTEIYSTGISRVKLFLLIALVFFLGVGFTVVVLFYTPAKQLVPGYPTNKFRRVVVHNSMMIDSLKDELLKRDNYLEQIRKVIVGEIIDDEPEPDSANENVEMAPMNDDSIFNSLIGPDKYKFSHFANDADFSQISRLNLFTPVQGVVINKFNASQGHFGTDIVGQENSYVSSVLDGTVIFAEWSVSTGYVVQIQHDNNLVSIYKHNSDVQVKTGESVTAGTVIAIMGNEGELSTGPHLHFEMWQNGVPLDPEQFISF